MSGILCIFRYFHLFQVCKEFHAFLCRLVRAHSAIVCGGCGVLLGGEKDKVVEVNMNKGKLK